MQNASTRTLGLRKPANSNQTSLKIPASSFRSLSIPNLGNAKVGHCYLRVTDVPLELEEFMEVNPRVPNRNDAEVLTGTVVKGIKDTLLESPEDMAIKNQGLFILADEVKSYKASGGDEFIEIVFTDRKLHGLVNGGHTFATIIDCVSGADDDQYQSLRNAYVKLHIFTGIDRTKVVDFASGLNSNKTVDDMSLADLDGLYEPIKLRMRNERGAEEISYHQGGTGDFYIAQVLVLLEMFNLDRFSEDRHPTTLYNSKQNGHKYYELDQKDNPKAIQVLVSNLPEILQLHDLIKFQTPRAARDNRHSLPKGKMNTFHFIGEESDTRTYNGWAYPMIAAFRANVLWKPNSGVFDWIVPNEKLVPEVIDDLVRVCILASKETGAPDKVGKQSSVYDTCFNRVEKAIVRIQKD